VLAHPVAAAARRHLPDVSAVALFQTVLVANRGEIACRVIETLRRLGIRSAAVYSDADASAKHVALADVAVRIGPAAAVQSYLSIEAVLDAAAQVGADAIHPGYGFLAENAEFARACAAAGIVFVGPSPAAIEAMGDKIAAKSLVAARGVPVVPGTQGAGLDDAALTAAAADVGYPLLIKPSAGGGGKGMQVVAEATELPAALASARRVATASFGDDTLLLERLIASPRHIEVQVLADRHGGVVHLGERECSLQRRHQKVIEEAPSPLLDDETRARIGEAACEAARSVDYEGAGTVEFLVSDADPGTFFFIEMNTRLQVEHPVTELVTGLDLVELQLRIAAGEPLPFAQEDVVLAGHAIEARVYAESPARGFLPATGTVLELREPAGVGLRIDSSLVPGLVVSGDYDPMLAKAIAYGADRAEALARLDGLLRDYAVLGVETNIEYLRGLLASPEDSSTGSVFRRPLSRPKPTSLPRRAPCTAPRRPRPGRGDSATGGAPVARPARRRTASRWAANSGRSPSTPPPHPPLSSAFSPASSGCAADTSCGCTATAAPSSCRCRAAPSGSLAPLRRSNAAPAPSPPNFAPRCPAPSSRWPSTRVPVSTPAPRCSRSRR
jgi:acetyl-CoA/propionyl-CoA carboxylase biotin carboxyl carrier protein